ncbi:xanthine dehydrogenase family protein molybdopterin-binding subunit [Terrimonas pollutisoli]|uniref:xanthine dehydrogenase family protein molybdopterin-binding subunit n=1 Tax=Terrimonas pollutisoli TaxID=3034147 RepID=UPI0023EAE234|nr:xanthine dehydrogenase family protein molybdopterin-binding subunit [Terrimonas sp. H1YJ31]
MDTFFDIETPGFTDRVDGKDKVTGAARYAAEHKLPQMTYAVIVGSSIAKGMIKLLDTKAAENAPGVLAVISHLNSPKVPGFAPADKKTNPDARDWEGLKIFYNNRVYSNGQPIAIVVADTYERAVYAASLVKAQYAKEEHHTDFLKNLFKAKGPKEGWDPAEYKRGEADAYKKAPVKVEEEYILPIETHNPMEMHAIIANWEADDKVTVYTKTQGPKDTQDAIVQAFKLPAANVKVIAAFVGGGFGSALRTWPHEIATIIAAKKVNRPVKLMLSRDQMFTMVGYRPCAWQKIGIGATTDGKLSGITHHAIAQTSSYENFTEGIVNVSKFLYACPNVNTNYKLLPLDVSTPIWMRGPGEATGTFALESALDELSYKLNLDPIELRIRNYAETDPEKNKPWSSKYLKECYQMGAEKIGWSKRSQTPGGLTEEGMQVGYGMGSGVFFALRWAGAAKGILKNDGSLILQSAVSDMGPGTATAMVSIATEQMGIPRERIQFQLGDTSFPPGPTQGGSATVSTLGSAVHEVCEALKQQLVQLSLKEGTVFHTKDIHTVKPEDLVFADGKVALKTNPAVNMSYADVLKQNNIPQIEIVKESKGGEELNKYSMYSFSVHFTKVHVNPITGVVKVKQVVTTGDAGKIVNEKTARSQMIGGVVGGIGMALTEEAIIDHRYGRYINNNFADYHVPVNADVPFIDALFVNKPDPVINPMGAKGMGEIALIGYASSVANAVYNATGKRIRQLPITPDKLL